MERKKTILIVDDDESMRETLTSLLEQDGYNLNSAENGKEALRKAEQLLPDVILLDVMMPEMDGFEVTKRIRMNSKIGNIPIIMVTALDDRDSLLKGFESGVDDFLSKPFDRSGARARIKTTTTLNRYRLLLSERTKFEWVIDHSDNGYLIINKNDEIIFSNKKAKTYFSLDLDYNETRPTKFKEIASNHYKLEPAKEWEKWPILGENGISLYLIKPENDESNAFWLKVDILYIPSGDKSEQIICLSDVSPDISSQINLRSFHNMVLHKLRTPSSGLIGSLEILSMMNLESLSKEQINQFVGMAYNNVKRLNETIEDILQYIKVPLITKSIGGFSILDLTDIIKEVGDHLNLKSIKVEIDDIIKKLVIRASHQAIELIAWEILENSKKFHPKQDPVIYIYISLNQKGRINIKFIDNGIRLSPEILTNAWNPYFQGEKRFTGNIKGMGLGLSMISSLIWSIDGECTIYNRDDEPGVIVELNIPLMIM